MLFRRDAMILNRTSAVAQKLTLSTFFISSATPPRMKQLHYYAQISKGERRRIRSDFAERSKRNPAKIKKAA